MNLYEITLTHLAPKDSATAIKEYLVAENDIEVFEYLTKGEGKRYTYWEDKVNGDYWKEDGYEKEEAIERIVEWIDNTIREQGEHWNEDLYCDLYYGRTIYGWRKTNVADEELMRLMVKNGIAKQYKKGE